MAKVNKNNIGSYLMLFVLRKHIVVSSFFIWHFYIVCSVYEQD
jgi:hypothetical protein